MSVQMEHLLGSEEGMTSLEEGTRFPGTVDTDDFEPLYG